MATLSRVLVANRGEIAIRIAKAASQLGMSSVAVFAPADSEALHPHVATDNVALTMPDGNTDPVSAYLDIPAIVEAAAAAGCDCVHPGYGFLSENAAFARACEERGLTFVGPSAATLELFGDKTQARQLASSLGIPTVPGTEGVAATVDEALLAATALGYPVMLKAASGGGGRGMRVVHEASELPEAFTRCASEANAAFGSGAVFVEKLIDNPRHIEVQILADSAGQVVHFFDRDCSVQLRHQKVVEVAPAPALDETMRGRMLADAVKLASAVDYVNAGTVEFLVAPESGEYFFIECNPRIQVEHTVTEQVMGVDLVEAQLRIAGGTTLAELGFDSQKDIGEPRGYAVQARVVATGVGTMNAYKEPSGPGVRVDGAGFAGYSPSPQFDPLFAKVIGWSASGGSVAAAVDRTLGALDDFHVEGLSTNLPQLRAILHHDAVRTGGARTTLLQSNPELMASSADGVSSSMLQFLNNLHSSSAANAAPAGNAATLAATPMPPLNVAVDEVGVTCEMAGGVVEVRLEVGAQVAQGDTLLVISAMKMEAMVSAPCAGVITATQPLEIGNTVSADQVVAVLAPSDDDVVIVSSRPEETWGPVLDDVARLKELALERLSADSMERGVVRQRDRGKLTCRQRIDVLLDADSFREVGSLAGFASYDEDGAISDFTPANHVGGWGKIDQRTAIVCADDFTSRGGHADGAIGQKSRYLDKLSLELRAPSVRLLDGSSGGGSVATMVPKQKDAGDSSAQESTGAVKSGKPRVAGAGGSFLPAHLGSELYTEQLSTVPVVNMLLGSVVGIGAAKAVLGHFSVMVREISQLFVAGPPVVSHAMGYDITKEDLGGWHIHCCNGSVDNLAESEQEAMAMTRQFLSYLPSSVYEAPPVNRSPADDSPERREEALFSIVPRKRTTTFDVRKVIGLIADKNSFFEIGPLWGTDQVTGFIRMNGHPMGVIASDSNHINGGALTADGCDKLKRHIDLCDLFHLPILNLVDNPGFAVGLEHEIRSTIRRGGEWMVAFAQIQVPVFTVLMRRSFGVAGNNYATPLAGPSVRVVWPAADVGGIPPEGGIEAAYKRQLADAEDPVALRAELDARIESVRGPIGPLSRFEMEEMIDPRDTRRYVCEWIENAYRIVSQPSRLTPRALQFRP